MKILVISDTHKNIKRALAVYEKLRNVDFVIHLGDYMSDADKLAEILDTEVISVAGNMDEYEASGDGGSTSSALNAVVQTEYGKLLLTHGHREQVKFSYDRLLYRAEEFGCKAVLFGHTHVPLCTRIDGIHIVNPGSISFPRGGMTDDAGRPYGSYAVITTAPDEFHCAIVYDKEPEDTGSGGFHKIRNMLNYSDRF